MRCVCATAVGSWNRWLRKYHIENINSVRERIVYASLLLCPLQVKFAPRGAHIPFLVVSENKKGSGLSVKIIAT